MNLGYLNKTKSKFVSKIIKSNMDDTTMNPVTLVDGGDATTATNVSATLAKDTTEEIA